MPDLPSGTVTFLFTDVEGSMRLGTADALLGETGALLDPSQREVHASTAAEARALLGDLAFEEAEEQGRRMTLAEAVDYALEAIHA